MDPVTTGVVSTSHHPTPAILERARSVAAACGLPLVPRRDLEEGAPALVVEALGAYVVLPDRVMRSHPGMGLVRIRRLLRGQRDPVVDIGEIRAGDAILDATTGFAQDAIVMAHAAGPEGRVLGFESSPLLAGLLLAGGPLWPRQSGEAMRRIDIRCADGTAFLRDADDASFDVVFLDPMFQRPRPAAPDFATLRMLADMRALTPEDISRARRVARRWVIVKDAWPGRELERLGVPAIPFRRSAEIVFGRIAGSGR
jgi:hypothetical protein